MSQQYQGDSTNVAFPSAGAIIGATNANPIQITVSGSLPVQLTAGMTDVPVTIDGVQGNTAANGVWRATITGNQTFTLQGSSGSGAYTSGGTVAYRVTNSYAQPSDGDDEAAASVDVALETLGDRTAFLTEQTGAYRLVTVANYFIDDDTDQQWGGTVTTLANSGQWIPVQILTGVDVFGAAGLVGVDVISGDVVRVEARGNYNTESSPYSSIKIGLMSALSTDGTGNSPAPSSFAKMFASADWGLVSGGQHPFHTTAIASQTQTGKLWIALGALMTQAVSSGGGTSIAGDAQIVVSVWRPTGVPQ